MVKTVGQLCVPESVVDSDSVCFQSHSHRTLTNSRSNMKLIFLTYLAIFGAIFIQVTEILP